MNNNYRIGLIVPSSNTTMETEIPMMLQSRMKVKPEESFTFHSSRMRMKNVSLEELKKMDRDSERCASELSDADCDILAYACLVAIMCQKSNYHKISEERLGNIMKQNTDKESVVSSAGALISGIKAIGAEKVSIITPYMKPLTKQVINYLEGSGIKVMDSISLEVSNNLEVGRLDPQNLIHIVDSLEINESDAVILSACVQMPSLPAIQKIEEKIKKPVLSASTATVYQILKNLKLETFVPNSGSLLSGKY